MNICCVPAVVKDSIGVLKYVVCLCKGCDGCCVFRLYCDAWSCRCSCIGSRSVSSCIFCMVVFCVHPVAVLSATFCMICSLLRLVEDARGDHMAIKQSKNNNSQGPDKLNIRHLKHIGPLGLAFLTNMFKTTLNKNTIPHT